MPSHAPAFGAPARSDSSSERFARIGSDPAPPNAARQNEPKPFRAALNAGRPNEPKPHAARRNPGKPNEPKPGKPKSEPEILFQQFFKSVGPRTYVAQVKKAGNGNHFIVLTEGKRDDKTGEVRKTRLFVFSEDFEEYFALLRDTVAFVKAHPMPAEMVKKRQKFWAKQAEGANRPSGKPRTNPSRPVATAPAGRP